MAITFPSSLRPAHPPPDEEPEGLSFSYAGPASGGGAFLAGDYEGEAVVGEVTRHHRSHDAWLIPTHASGLS